MKRLTFKDYVLREEASTSKDWKSEAVGPPLAKGFIPPPKMRPVIRAFLNSDKIVLLRDTGSKHLTMPKKTLFLVGGAVRDFIKNNPVNVGHEISDETDASSEPHDLDLATNATPEQIAIILSAAGFKRAGDRSGKGGQELDIPSSFENADGEIVRVKDAAKDDNRYWFIKGRDNSKERKPFVISAVVDGVEFEIATFRNDAKTVNGKSAVDFTDNPLDDAARRDFTINALYIELGNADSENKKLYDPSKSGLHDLMHGVVKTVGKASERFEEDPIRVMRAIRFHCKFGQGEKLHQDILNSLPKFKDLRDRIALDRIKKEFVKGLQDDKVDIKKYVNIYKNTGILSSVFPGLNFEAPNEMPVEFSGSKDHILALAWILHNNSPEEVEKALDVRADDKSTGWTRQEQKAVVHLLKLLSFNQNNLTDYLRHREGTGLSPKQIKAWVELFKQPNSGRYYKFGPVRAGHVKNYADFQRGVTWDNVVRDGLHKCPECKGMNPENCTTCSGAGEIPPNQRQQLINKLEVDRFTSPKK
jgi:tRNA nucleotidyltransferase/poly(A) polymerase